jgi:hypothetical protein
MDRSSPDSSSTKSNLAPAVLNMASNFWASSERIVAYWTVAERFKMLMAPMKSNDEAVI